MLGKATVLTLLLALPFVAVAAPNSSTPSDNAGCSPVTDGTGNLICSLNGAFLATSTACMSMDLDTLGKKLRETAAIGFLTKLTLKGEVDTMLVEARAMRTAAPDPGRAAALQRKFEQMHGGLVEKLATDPSLATAISCNRDALWNALLTK